LGSSQPLQERFTCDGILVPLFLHIVSAAKESSLFPKDTRPCHALPDTLFLHRHHLCSYGHKDIASALEREDNCSVTNSPNITTTSVCSWDTKLYTTSPLFWLSLVLTGKLTF
jgi:hypothetical protein